ncbi:MAG: hypothetical protein V4773_01150, partial [Verrucomicrobiota bacterium]
MGMGLLWATTGALASEAGRLPHVTGSLPLRVWRLEDRGASSIYWAVAVHPATGFVYVANQNGLLQFDGVRWQLIPLPRGGAVRSVAVGPDGRVWLGGSGQICMLEADARGALRAVDAGARLPEFQKGPEGIERAPQAARNEGLYIPALDTRLIGDAPQAIPGADGVYFVLPGRIARFRPSGEVDVWAKTLENRFPGWWSDGALHVVHGNDGIFRYGADGTPASLGKGGLRVLAAGPHPVSGWIWLTGNGPVHVNNRRRDSVLSEEAAELFRNDRPRCALLLPDGSSVYGTVNHGVVLLDLQGRIVQVVNRTRGLPANRVNGLALDREGGLWLAMHAGLVRVQLDTPFALHGLAQGLSGSRWEVKRDGDRLYAAHSEGVAWRDAADGRFHAVPGISAAIHQIAVARDQVVAAGLGLYAVRRSGPAQALTPNDFRHGVALSRTWPEHLFHFGTEDVQFWQREPSEAPLPWRLGGTFSNLATGAEDVCDDGKGFVWVVSGDARVRRLDVREGLRTSAPVKTFGPGEGLPVAARSDKVRFLRLGGELLVTSRLGIWRYDSTGGRFVREVRLAPAGPGPDAVTSTETGAWLYYAKPRPRLQAVRIEPEGSWSATDQLMPALSGLAVLTLFADEAERTLWIATQSQLLSLTLDWRGGPPPAPPQAQLRRVQTLAGEPLWRATPFAAPSADEAPALTFEPRQRAVRLEFTAMTYQTGLHGESTPRFRTRVEGIEAGWSA